MSMMPTTLFAVILSPWQIQLELSILVSNTLGNASKKDGQPVPLSYFLFRLKKFGSTTQHNNNLLPFFHNLEGWILVVPYLLHVKICFCSGVKFFIHFVVTRPFADKTIPVIINAAPIK